MTELPGGPDGKWANYVAFCGPSRDAVVTTTVGAAFAPATEEPVASAIEPPAGCNCVHAIVGSGYHSASWAFGDVSLALGPEGDWS